MICDRQTDGQTDRGPGKNNMSPDPEGGRHNKKYHESKIFLPTSEIIIEDKC